MATRTADRTQLPLPFRPGGGGEFDIPPAADTPTRVLFVRHRRARHYILRLRDDGVIRVTVPWRGSRAQAERFLAERREWIARERQRREQARESAGVPADVEAHLRRLAARLLPARLAELARAHGFTVAGVRIGNQRTRWGSCSPSGRISLNWRLVQVPLAVCEYVLLHELTHLRHPDHSARFWRELTRLCPHCAESRQWLRSSTLLPC